MCTGHILCMPTHNEGKNESLEKVHINRKDIILLLGLHTARGHHNTHAESKIKIVGCVDMAGHTQSCVHIPEFCTTIVWYNMLCESVEYT